MSKDNKEKLPELNEEKLVDDELEQVSGGQIEIAEDEAAVSARGTIVIRGITGSDGGHWA